MTKVEQLEREIRKLSPEELRLLLRRLRELDANAWDKEIEADVAAGKLDGLAEEALAEHRAGKTKPV